MDKQCITLKFAAKAAAVIYLTVTLLRFVMAVTLFPIMTKVTKHYIETAKLAHEEQKQCVEQ